ncbi:MAG: 50S ribosomal protein L21, partial [Chloroflexi bacterium RBG_16_57_9]
VEVGKTLDVDLMPVTKGETVTFDRVLLVADGDEVKIGQPTLDGAQVRATVLGEVKGEKIIVFKYKPKLRHRRKTGHRQRYTRLQIDEIVV